MNLLMRVLPASVLLILLTGCNQESIVGHVDAVVQDPSKLPVAFVGTLLIIILFLWWNRTTPVIYDLIDAIIITSLMTATLGPFFYLTTERIEVTYVMFATGVIGLGGGLIARLTIMFGSKKKPKPAPAAESS